MKKLVIHSIATLALTLSSVAFANPGGHYGGGGGHGGWHGGRWHPAPNPGPHFPPSGGGWHGGGGGWHPAPPPRQIWHGGGWRPRPILRYAYRPLVWGTLFGILTYHHFRTPAQFQWACVASSNGIFGDGYGFSPEEAQERALLQCGPACMDGTYAMDCAPRY